MNTLKETSPQLDQDAFASMNIFNFLLKKLNGTLRPSPDSLSLNEVEINIKSELIPLEIGDSSKFSCLSSLWSEHKLLSWVLETIFGERIDCSSNERSNSSKQRDAGKSPQTWSNLVSKKDLLTLFSREKAILIHIRIIIAFMRMNKMKITNMLRKREEQQMKLKKYST